MISYQFFYVIIFPTPNVQTLKETNCIAIVTNKTVGSQKKKMHPKQQ